MIVIKSTPAAALFSVKIGANAADSLQIAVWSASIHDDPA